MGKAGQSVADTGEVQRGGRLQIWNGKGKIKRTVEKWHKNLIGLEMPKGKKNKSLGTNLKTMSLGKWGLLAPWVLMETLERCDYLEWRVHVALTPACTLYLGEESMMGLGSSVQG